MAYLAHVGRYSISNIMIWYFKLYGLEKIYKKARNKVYQKPRLIEKGKMIIDLVSAASKHC